MNAKQRRKNKRINKKLNFSFKDQNKVPVHVHIEQWMKYIADKKNKDVEISTF